MTDGTESSGTTTPDPVGAQESGTADRGSVGATAEAVDWKAKSEELERKFEQSLREKGALEEERRRRQELEQENAQLRGGYGTAPAAGNLHQQAADEMRQYYYELQQANTPEARMILANLNFTQQLFQQQQFDRDLATVPVEKQAEVRKLAERQGLAPSVVYRALKGDQAEEREKALQAREAELEARRKRLDEEENARRRGRVDVTTTPIPARDFQNGEYSRDAYIDDCRRAELGDEASRQRLNDFDEGRLKFK